MHDFGTGRCDFPGGSSEQMFNSIKTKLYTLPDNVKVFVGYDYMPNGRELGYKSTIGIQKKLNPHINSMTQKNNLLKIEIIETKLYNLLVFFYKVYK